MQFTLTFQHPLNHSLQVGDTVWYTEVSPSGGYDIAPTATKLGTVVEVSDQYQAHQIKVSNNTLDNFSIPDLFEKYIMFSKDNRANLTSLVGYYAEAKFENNSKEKAELFSVSSEVAQSSK
tara:strand:- start:420 stop:782 length:363 start_codon:yes stop_codon:yes gene_type:complete